MPRVTKITKIKNAPVTPPASDATKPMSRTLPVVIVLSGLLLIALSIAGYFYYQYKHTPEVANAEEVAKVVKAVGSMLELPADETPTLATVSDKTKLEDQPFFKKSANGDKVLIYADAGRAILYRPSTKKIIDITTIDLQAQANKTVAQDTATTPNQGTPATSPAVPPSPTPVPIVAPATLTIALYNGSAKIGVTNTLETDIVAQFPDVAVTVKEKAAKNDYQGNLIIDLSGKNADLVTRLAASIPGTVASLPAGEVTPTTDVLVIVGNK